MADWTQHRSRAQEIESGGVVRGRVIDALTHAGIGCAQVTLLGVDAMADDTGRFAFASVPAGPTTVVANVDGYAQGSAPVTAADGQDISVTISLTSVAGGAIEGTVVDGVSRAPVPGALVQLDMGRLVVADNAGAFVFALVDVGTHVLNVRAANYQSATGTAVVASGGVAKPVIKLTAGSGEPTGTGPASARIAGVPVIGIAAAVGLGWLIFDEFSKP